MYICIGKRKMNHHETVACTNTSLTPSVPAHPEWGFLCSECANTRQNGRRPQYEAQYVESDNEIDVLEGFAG